MYSVFNFKPERYWLKHCHIFFFSLRVLSFCNFAKIKLMRNYCGNLITAKLITAATIKFGDLTNSRKTRNKSATKFLFWGGGGYHTMRATSQSRTRFYFCDCCAQRLVARKVSGLDLVPRFSPASFLKTAILNFLAFMETL